MFKMFSVLAISAIFFSGFTLPRPVTAVAQISFTTKDTVTHPMGDPDKWLPVKEADAKALASQQGESWKKIVQEKNLLIGLGTDGPAKLKALLQSNDPVSKGLYDLLIRTADSSVAAPVPQYQSQSQLLSKGLTAVTASNELWIRPVADEVVLLAVAAKITDNAGYKQRLHDLVINLCSFPTWGSPPLNADLVAGHASRAVATAWNWNPGLWTGKDRSIVIDTVRKRVNILCKAIYGGPGGYWAGMYPGNHNQVSSAGAGISGVAFLNDIPEAKEWLAAAWLNFQQVSKVGYADGASAEGTAYLTLGTSFILQFIEAVNGVLPSHTLYDSPFLKNMATYRVNNTLPGFHGIIGWGDNYPVDFSGPQQFLLRFSSQYHDPLIRYAATHIKPGCGGGDDVKAWAWLWSMPAVEEQAPTKLDYHADVYDLVNTRSGWSADDYVLSFKSGFNNRSHSHLDAGAFALATGDNWLLPSAGYGKGGSSQDFWDKLRGRWTYQSNVTESNSTLLINKAQQRYDNNARGTIDHFESYDNAMLAECDLTSAYNDVSSVRRRIFHRRGEYFIIYDAANLKSPGLVEWLLTSPPNGVVNDNSVNIQGTGASVNVTMLTPNANFALRESQMKNDLKSSNKTLAASASGKDVSFVAVIEPKIRDKETPERTFSLTPDGAVDVKTSGYEERIYFAAAPSLLADKLSNTSATARMFDVRSEQGKPSEWIVTDATHLSADDVQLTSNSNFSAQLLTKKPGGWLLTITAGKNIEVKGGGKIAEAGTGKSVTAITGPGKYLIQH